jgi:4-hydroxy 2-oxovalerate aldolase
MGQIQLLDTTLRDGGLGFEDAVKQNNADNRYDTETISNIIRHLKASQIDIIELGSLELTSDDRRCFAIYQNIQQISETMPEHSDNNQMYVALFRGPDTPINDIPNWEEHYCEGIRVIIRYSELKKSLAFCKAIADKGYKMFVQPMLTMRYTDEEIQLLIDAANDMCAYALYFVDSYGYMVSEDIIRFYDRYDNGLNASIKIGFHAHNNMNLAFSNVISFLEQKTNRGLIIDSCAIGSGQGAGNLQTEIIADYLNKYWNKSYDFDSILDLCEIVEKYLNPNPWGYSVTTLLPAQHRTAYKFSISLRNKYKMSYREINDVLTRMPDKMRQRYTAQDTEELLDLLGYSREELLGR